MSLSENYVEEEIITLQIWWNEKEHISIMHSCVHRDCDTLPTEAEVRTVKIHRYIHILTANITEL
jgi:hypothetical protein